MWSSTGGGWRSMMACIGFANMFGQAQLLPLPSDPSSTSDRQYFDAISTTSGASWFSTQFFYSSNFYAQTMTDPASLIKNWMTAYQDIGKEIEKDDLKCLLPSDLPKHKNSKFEKLLQLCDVTMHYDNQWAAFVTAFLNHTAVTAYQDSVYGQLQANPENRIADMKDNNIKLLLHTTLVPQTRTFNREFLDINEDYVSNLVPNLGPGSDNDITYSGVLPVTFSVDSQMNATNGVFTIGAGYPLQVHQSKTKRLFHEEDWKHYGLYPLDAQDTYIISTDSDAKNLGPLDSNFFAGAPLTTQVASISSAAVGGLSPSVPSVFAQMISQEKHMLKGKDFDEVAMDIAVQALYDSDFAKGLAVCSQWPKEPCGDLDGRFLDGAYTDNPALIQNIAHYQQSDNANLTKTLKIVLTNTNTQADTPERAYFDALFFVKYFKNEVNSNAEPGMGYLWTENVPYGSPQIFEEELTTEDFGNITVPIPNSNVTTRLLSGTTIDNPLWRTKGGQSVQILVISINSPIPNLIVGSSEAQEYTQPLVDMAMELANNKVLQTRVKAFFSNNEALVDFDEGTQEVEEEDLIKEIMVDGGVEELLSAGARSFGPTLWICLGYIVAVGFL